jgi:hypothetical protein
VVANRVMEKGCTRKLGQLTTAYGIGALPTSADQHAECRAARGRHQSRPSPRPSLPVVGPAVYTGACKKVGIRYNSSPSADLQSFLIAPWPQAGELLGWGRGSGTGFKRCLKAVDRRKILLVPANELMMHNKLADQRLHPAPCAKQIGATQAGIGQCRSVLNGVKK